MKNIEPGLRRYFDFILGMYSNNSEWFLANASCIRSDKEYVCCPGQLFPDVSFYITIARRSLFYLLNLIFPMTIIGMLTMCSFLLPAESGKSQQFVLYTYLENRVKLYGFSDDQQVLDWFKILINF